MINLQKICVIFMCNMFLMIFYTHIPVYNCKYLHLCVKILYSESKKMQLKLA